MCSASRPLNTCSATTCAGLVDARCIHQNDIGEAEQDIAMSYTIEVRSVPMLDSKVVGRFTDAVWDSLWQELQITSSSGTTRTPRKSILPF